MSTTVDFNDLYELFDAKALEDLRRDEPDMAGLLIRYVANGATPDEISRVIAAYTGSEQWSGYLCRAAKAAARQPQPAQRQGGTA